MPRIELFARTEVGCVRERNEDAFIVVDLATGQRGLPPDGRARELEPPGTLVAVCDGLGGAAAGDVASRLAADVFADVLLGQRPDGDVDHVAQTLLHAVGRANRRILDYALANPKSRGMGTTITAAVAMGPELVLAQVGDSRAYLRRGRALQQLTVDHSIVGQMLESGEITPEQARSADQRNVLLQALGVQEQVQPDVVRVSLLAGDVLLLCSDGLSGVLDDAAILELLMRHPDPLRCCRALTEAACAKGGPDNVSVAVARFVGDGLPVPLGRQPIQFRRDRAMVA